MTPEQFQTRLHEMRHQFGDLFDRYGLQIIGNVAVSWFKKNFQNQAWGRVKWQEVQRRTPGTKANRYAAKHHPAQTTRRILTGDTGDLGRSIEIREAANGSVTIWTNPSAFGSKEPYGRVHNEGLRAGRGKGFTMPRRQFMGESPELDDFIAKKALMAAQVADGDSLRQTDAQLRYYMHIARPEDLTDEEWAMRVRELEWVRKEEAKQMPK